jgi:hypothetical protein
MENKGPSFEDVMKYEDGDMTEEEVVEFFQKLIDSGMAWSLQGHYGRTAQYLIKSGRCVRKEG